ncbi:arginase, partial [Cognatilysobacter lacus]
EALRIAGLGEALQARGLDVLDRGNLDGPRNPWQDPVGGYRHVAEVTEWNRIVMDAMHGELVDGRVPILLGGDHCLGLGSIAGVARWCRENGRTLRVLWLDAHADFNTSDVTPSGNIHGMPVSCLCGLGPDSLTHLSGVSPAVRAEDIRQIGIRSVDEGERRLLRQYGIDVYDMRYIDEVGMRAAMEEALDGMGPDTHLHVSFDVDFLDPSIAPGVGTTVMGGPTYREASLVMEMICDTGRLGSLDIMELNPLIDDHNRTAILVVDLVESLFGKSTLLRE